MPHFLVLDAGMWLTKSTNSFWTSFPAPDPIMTVSNIFERVRVANLLFQVLISAPVQLFICWRIKVISGSWLLASTIIFFAVCSFSRSFRIRECTLCDIDMVKQSWRCCNHNLCYAHSRIFSPPRIRWSRHHLAGFLCCSRHHYHIESGLVSGTSNLPGFLREIPTSFIRIAKAENWKHIYGRCHQ